MASCGWAAWAVNRRGGGILGLDWLGSCFCAWMASVLKRRGMGIFGRAEVESVFPGFEGTEDIVAEVGSGLIADASGPSDAQPPVAGSRAATRAHAGFCSLCFRIALRFTGLTPFTLMM